MKVYNFSSEEDKKALLNLFENHFKRGSFVPFFGSGFTKGCSAGDGNVPSVDEFKKFLAEMVAKNEEYTDEELSELNKESIAQVSEFFWQAMDHAKDENLRKDFFSYIENHFSGVHDISEEKHQLVNCSWRYLYTLNYDDTIENASLNSVCVAPFTPQNKGWLAQRRCIYKLHGDVHQYLLTGDARWCILSAKQYLTAMNAPTNADMREKLESDFSSNNIIFFGCSLLDELDLLLISDMRLFQKKKQNSDTHSYYVRYIDNDTPTMTKVSLGKYEQYSITDIINVPAASIVEFYSFIHSISDAAAALKESDKLTSFMGFSLVKRDPHDREANIKYIFYSGELHPNTNMKQILLPSFFIHRKVGMDIINNIELGTCNLHILRGSCLSGKTYILIDILRHFQSRDIYYFPSGTVVSDNLLNKLINLQDTILLFDEHTVSQEQINILTSTGLDSLEEKHSYAVVAVNISLDTFTQYYFIAFPQLEGHVSIYHLSRKLESKGDYNEFENFSSEVGKLGIPSPRPDSTFLDFMIQMDKASIHQNRASLPDVHILNGTDRAEKLKALILFANQDAITIPQANSMGIDTALYSLCAMSGVEKVVQKDYLTEAELTQETHYRLRFIVNSKFWVYKCLTEYAANRSNFDEIAKAYYNIVKAIQCKYGFKPSKKMSNNYYHEVYPYYFLDAIQFTFFGLVVQGGSLSLPQKIYDRLLPLLQNDYQYLHQKAKYQMRSSKREGSPYNRQALLNAAFQQINRAYELAEQNINQNTHYTLYHMMVTKALILVNYWRYCNSILTNKEKVEHISITLRAVHQMVFEMETHIGDDSSDRLDEQGMQDIKWFITDLGGGETRQALVSSDLSLAGETITLATKNLRRIQYPQHGEY